MLDKYRGVKGLKKPLRRHWFMITRTDMLAAPFVSPFGVMLERQDSPIIMKDKNKDTFYINPDWRLVRVDHDVKSDEDTWVFEEKEK